MNTPAPRRLIDQGGELGELMRDATRQYSRGLDANRAWQRQLERQRRPVLGRLVPASFAFAVAAAALVIGVKYSQSGDNVIAQPEPTLPNKQVQPEEPKRNQPAVKEQQKREPLPKPERTKHNLLREPRGAQPIREELVAPPAPSVEDVKSVTPEAKIDCLSFARSGDPKRAASCFETQASGSGLSAEVALYELARLRRDVIGDPAGALSALDDYTRRFANGSLSGEVRFSRLELLARLGRAQEALADSQALLISRFGGERSAEIRLLRGNLYLRSLGDPASAAREYELASKGSGRVADEAAFALGLSHEKAGNLAAARAAFKRYAERPGARRAAEAAAKLKALGGE